MSNSPIIDRLLAKTRRTDIPDFKPGDTVRVYVKIKEGDKERVQMFEGLVISKTRGSQPSFIVRKMSFGHGVERIFPLNSKVVDKVEVVRSAHVRPLIAPPPRCCSTSMRPGTPPTMPL